MYVEPEFPKPTVDSEVTLRKVTGDTVGIICRLSVAKEDLTLEDAAPESTPVEEP